MQNLKLVDQAAVGYTAAAALLLGAAGCAAARRIEPDLLRATADDV